ncbi:MAG: cation-transporting P-type ATPase [Halobacteriota archaeon]
MTRKSNSESTPAKDTAAWYTLSVDECTRRLEVDPDTGLGTNESAQRLEKYGHSELADAKKESGIKAFLRQYHSLMQIVLSAMTLVSIIIHDY